MHGFRKCDKHTPAHDINPKFTSVDWVKIPILPAYHTTRRHRRHNNATYCNPPPPRAIARTTCLAVILVAALFAALGFSHASVAQDRAALVALYNATGGANWTHSTNWLSSEPLDKWYGVTTNADGRVIGLFLLGNNLSGTLPAEVGNLGNLEYLFLENNALSGDIPAELSNLANLKTLRLQNNSLTGLPWSLNEHASLQNLRVEGNSLTGCVSTHHPSLISNALDAAGLQSCHPDHEVLVAFYNATGGANWTNSHKTNWLSHRPIRDWYGVDQ